MKSLYEYLGYAAGGALGKAVNDAAQKSKQKFVQKEISNPKYTGMVFMYEESFLDEFFNKKKTTPPQDYSSGHLNEDDHDDLPF